MASVQRFEDRLSALETEVQNLKKLIGTEKPKQPWWELWSGAFENDPIFDEAMKLGREYRESLRPKPRRKRRKPK